MLPTLACLASFALPLWPSDPLPGDGLSERLINRIESSREHWIEFRRDLHRHPELAGEEVRTAAAVVRELEALGLEVRSGVGGHGVVAILHGAEPGRVLGFRADMDAVRTPDHDPVPFRSEVEGVRHVCGHDIHTTVGLALAEALTAVRDSWKGTLVFYFQPAEETAQGARLMIEDGALSEPRPEECFAFHTSPLPVGSVGVTPGQALAMRDSLRVVLQGTGDLPAAAEAIEREVLALTTLEDPVHAPSQEEDFLVAGIFRRRRGEARDGLVLEGQATLTSDTLRQACRSRLKAWLEAADFEHVTAELTWTPRSQPGVFNSPRLVDALGGLLERELGPGRYVVDHKVPIPFSEDFGFFQERAPGVMYWLGVSNPEKGTAGYPHSPNFVADEESIFVGTRAMATLLLARLRAD